MCLRVNAKFLWETFSSPCPFRGSVFPSPQITDAMALSYQLQPNEIFGQGGLSRVTDFNANEFCLLMIFRKNKH